MPKSKNVVIRVTPKQAERWRQAAAACWARVGAAVLRRARPSLPRAGGQPQRPG